VRTGFWWGDLMERKHSEELGDNIKMDLQEMGWVHELN
jgi:hypothetical protein